MQTAYPTVPADVLEEMATRKVIKEVQALDIEEAYYKTSQANWGQCKVRGIQIEDAESLKELQEICKVELPVGYKNQDLRYHFKIQNRQQQRRHLV